MPRPTPRLAAAGRVPTDICGHRRRGPLGPLAALSGPPGAGVRPGHIPGSPRHCDIHKLQRHHQQNVPKCRGSWSPAARPRKLCPGGQGPCKQQESRLPAAQTPGGLARAAGPGAEDAGPTPRGSSAEQLGSQPDGGSELPAVLLRVREEKPLLSPQGSLRHGHGVAEPAASTLAVGTGSDLCRAEGTRVDLPGGLTAPGAEPRAAAARQRPHSCSLTSARLRGAPHQGGGSTHTPHRRRPQRSAAPWPWDAPTLTPGGELGHHLPRPTRTGRRDPHMAMVPRPPDVVSRGAGLSAPRNTDKQGRTVHVLSGPVTGDCDGKADSFVGLQCTWRSPRGDRR